MTWTNAFDAGECTVVVTHHTSGGTATELYRGVMTKGETETFGDDSYEISVSDSGAVSLSGPQIGGGGGGLDVEVIPTSVPDDASGRVSGISIGVGMYGSYAYAYKADDDDGVDLDGPIDGEWTPDPCEFASPVSLLAISGWGRGV